MIRKPQAKAAPTTVALAPPGTQLELGPILLFCSQAGPVPSKALPPGAAGGGLMLVSGGGDQELQGLLMPVQHPFPPPGMALTESGRSRGTRSNSALLPSPAGPPLCCLLFHAGAGARLQLQPVPELRRMYPVPGPLLCLEWRGLPAILLVPPAAPCNVCTCLRVRRGALACFHLLSSC